MKINNNCYLPDGWGRDGWGGLYFNETRLVSRSCHVGVVANAAIDFKLCCSRKDGSRVRRKIESSSSEAKIILIRAERRKIFTSRPGKKTNGLSFSALEGKIEQRIQIILARKRPRLSSLSKQLCPALTSSIENCDRHLKTHQKR